MSFVPDFGFAHYLIGETDSPHLRGSPLYMAPEIVIKRQYNEKADLWSVGVILYGEHKLVLPCNEFVHNSSVCATFDMLSVSCVLSK